MLLKISCGFLCGRNGKGNTGISFIYSRLVSLRAVFGAFVIRLDAVQVYIECRNVGFLDRAMFHFRILLHTFVIDGYIYSDRF